MKVFLQKNERRIDVHTVATFEEASAYIAEVDAFFTDWERAGFPPDPFPPELAFWEGCDVFLEDEHGNCWMHTDLGWQEYSKFRQRRAT